eukprot:358989-Chlamydomonas_euryale.AAC.10
MHACILTPRPLGAPVVHRGRGGAQDDVEGGEDATRSASGKHCQPQGGVPAQAEAGGCGGPRVR